MVRVACIGIIVWMLGIGDIRRDHCLIPSLFLSLSISLLGAEQGHVKCKHHPRGLMLAA